MKEQGRIRVDDPRAERVLFDALKSRARGRTELVRMTRADAVTLTGLPGEQAQPALEKLVKSYRSHIEVTDEGELVYEFDPSLERRDRVTLRERARRAADVAWRGFQIAFKIWIVVTLVVYVVAFILMMISLVVAKSSSDRDDRRGGDGGFGLPWIWWWLMPDLAPAPRDRYGRALRRPAGPPRKRFYLAVFDYVFGPKQAPIDPRLSDKRLLAYLRDHKGRVTASDLVALTGVSYDVADEELTRLLVEYDGEVEVAESGALLYVFKDLLTSAEDAGTRWTYAWDTPDPKVPLTGNTAGTNAVITGFSAFNLVASMTIGPAFLQRVHLSADPTANFFVTVFPLIFSAIFFAVPGARALLARRRNRAQRARQLRRQALREVWASPGAQFAPDAVSRVVAEKTHCELGEARATVEKVLADLDGDVATDAQGAMRYTFPRLADERAAVDQARDAAPDDERRLGPVIFSSRDERLN